MFIALMITILGACMVLLLNSFRRPRDYPPGPTWLPFVGNTPYIRKLSKKHGGQHIVFEKLSKDFNSALLGLKLGNELVVVALTYPIVKEVQTREEFDGRPDNFFLRLRTMGTRLGITCTDGSLWNEHRHFAVRHLREAGYGRQAMGIQIQNELNELLGLLKNLDGRPEWPGNILPSSVINVLWTFTTGQRIDRQDNRLSRLLQLLQERSKAFDMSGGLLNQMPWLRFIAPEKTGYNLLNRFNKELHGFFMETINKHHEDYEDAKCSDDLIYAYIKEMRERQHDPNSTFTNIQLTMIILDIFIAGSQTTSITIDLALMMMLVRPEIQEKIHCEIDLNLDTEEVPSLNNRLMLPYTEAVLLEVQRFFHIVPISGPRRCTKDTILGGLRIPKDTTILMSLKTVHMDPEYWLDPDVFRPERFIDENNKIYNTERVIPFGLGRRRCLGDALARACIFTFFVGILQKFKLLQPHDTVEKPSLILQPGITLSPKPYNILFSPRC